MSDTNTDDDWERWGRQDPYYGVITDPRFRRGNLSEAERDYFFVTGQLDVDRVMGVIRERVAPGFAPRSVLDFGCGVGRTLFAFARTAEVAVGIDVSPSMLVEAAAHRRRLELEWVELLAGGDLAPVQGRRFDLVHSAIVLQHVDVKRGLTLFQQLVDAVAPGGVGAIQLTYSRRAYADRLGEPPPPPPPAPAAKTGRRPLPRRPARAARPPAAEVPAGADPPMLMHCYPLTQLFFVLQSAGYPDVYTDFTDHGGEWGVHLYFRRPLPAA